MSIKGITLTAKFDGPVSFDEEWVNRLYTSLENNIAIVSCDVGLDEDRGLMSVTLGVDSPEGLDPESLVDGIARDAIDLAIRTANGDIETPTEALPIVNLGRVEAFA